MNIDELTIGDIKKISSLVNIGVPAVVESKTDNHPYTIGNNWFFRTVTHHLIGEIKNVGQQEITLKGGTVMWVADDGKFSELFEKGEPAETEPYGNQDVVIGRGSIIDATCIKINIKIVVR